MKAITVTLCVVLMLAGCKEQPADETNDLDQRIMRLETEKHGNQETIKNLERRVEVLEMEQDRMRDLRKRLESLEATVRRVKLLEMEQDRMRDIGRRLRSLETTVRSLGSKEG